MKSFICDMDGVIYKGKNLINGADSFIHKLISSNAKFLFLTNNSEQSAQELKEKLNKLGISGLTENNFITSAIATAEFLKSQEKNKKVFVIGGSAIEEEIQKAGFILTDGTDDEAFYVIVGKTKNFNYEMLKKACNLITKGAKFIATNPDIIDPIETGFEPACGSILASIESATNKKAYIIGKPNALMMQMAKRKLEESSKNLVMIGDRMDTDIIAGMEAGMTTCLVLSGVSTKNTINNFAYKPDYVFEDVSKIDLNML